MEAQVEQLVRNNSVDAYTINSTTDEAGRREIYKELYNQDTTTKLLYVTPEFLCLSEEFRDALNYLYQRDRISHFVVDECHCISLWGYDFRPEYKQLDLLRQKYETAPIIALTAMATEAVQIDVVNTLQLQNYRMIKQSIHRDNLM